jgi:DNA polymerase
MVDSAALAALAWLVEMGAEEAIAASPVDRLNPPVVDRRANAAPVPALREPTASPARAVTAMGPSQTISSDAVASARALAAAARNLAELEAAVRAFDGCALKTTATNTVFADGVPGSSVMFVGEAPGADEDRLGRPFVGVSGQLLDRMLLWIGLERAKNFYIANVIYWRPPGNRTPTTAETATCLPFVQRQIELAAPRLLVFLGGSSAQTLLGVTGGIGRLRGRWHSYQSPGLREPLQAIATFHPAYLLRSPAQKRESWRDLLMVKNKMIANG